MTHINNHLEKANLNSIKNALTGFSAKFNSTVTAGMEVEKFLMKEDGSLPNAKDNDALYVDLLNELGDKTSTEPGSHMMEVKSAAHSCGRTIGADLLDKIGTLREIAASHKIKLLDTSDMPTHVSIQSLRDNLVSMKDPITKLVRRGPEIIQSCKDRNFNEIVDYTVSTSSVHFTHSTRGIDQLHRWAKVHSTLMPLYYAVFENRERNEGKHSAMEVRGNMGDRFLISDYIFQAKDGEDFAEKYIEFVTNSPMYSILDAKGQDKAFSEATTFNDLPEEEKTIGNFLQAASFNWGVCKVKPIIDTEALHQGEFKLSNLLLEARDFDAADESIPVISNWLYTLVKSEENLLEIENRLEDIGVPILSNPEEALELVKKSLQEVGSENSEYLETAIGNKNNSLRDLIKQVILPIANNNMCQTSLNNWKDIANSEKPIFNKAENTKTYKPAIGDLNLKHLAATMA